MPSETFYCTHCRCHLTKSAKNYVMGESSYFISLGGLSPEVICPACRGKIDTMKMIRGEYDRTAGKRTNPFVSLILVVCFFGGAIVGVGIAHEGFHWSWLPAILVGIMSGFIVMGIVEGVLTFFGKLLAWKRR